MNVPAYPLHWPPGWTRARSRSRSDFKHQGQRLTISQALRHRLNPELERLHARNITISTNVPPHRYDQLGDGIDPGVAVYFTLDGDPRVLACDRWDRTADNLVAVAKHIEALRGQERWGVGSLEQAFAGYKALPALAAARAWWEVLGLPSTATGMQIRARRLELLEKFHPDRPGGDVNQAAEVNAAYQAACAEGRA
jgi:hypothetical protein